MSQLLLLPNVACCWVFHEQASTLSNKKGFICVFLVFVIMRRSLHAIAMTSVLGMFVSLVVCRMRTKTKLKCACMVCLFPHLFRNITIQDYMDRRDYAIPVTRVNSEANRAMRLNGFTNRYPTTYTLLAPSYCHALLSLYPKPPTGCSFRAVTWHMTRWRSTWQKIGTLS